MNRAIENGCHKPLDAKSKKQKKMSVEMGVHVVLMLDFPLRQHADERAPH